MNRYFVLSVLLILPFFIKAQDLMELEKRNGFKEIKLNTEVTGYSWLLPKKSKSVTEGIEEFQMEKGKYTHIGEIKIHGVDVKTYKGMIYEINVVTSKEQNLYKGLEKAFGKPQNTVGYGAYSWVTDNLSLTFRSYSKSKLELVYHSFEFEKMVKADKAQKVEDVSSDF